MPELPEVEIVRAGLEPFLTGRRVTRVDVLDERAVRRHEGGAADFAQRLTGLELTRPARRGKYLWFPTSGGDAILAHLGMSGQFRIDAPGDPLARNTRILLDLDDGSQVRFIDQRLFGGLSFSPGGARLPAEIAHIALDPFDERFDVPGVARAMQSKRSTVKRVLLDQRVVSGIGNIYADESLWRARCHCGTPTQLLSTRRARAVLRAARRVMAEALAVGGTSFDQLYVHVNGSSGYFDRELAAYGRAGKPCPRCGTPIVREAFMNRSSYRCPRCQRLPKSPASGVGGASAAAGGATGE
ncbi:bifunctional DNA-formamidopyrimidine glycosylase/DNA-(apurinic or apyrimidinic site) lyase [uncultured Propionibacterium sp.]|uniref:bifunctional DNA-formamidopyrimidine glycosylase/DNA-(apurinic or apyrimidinic site) lyase n=1 Tax=uncultured Propionibacterium sp. TaxID=218066 RepID=UPI00292D8781|nr:bifunctional DNA-formamidopyrimidine glycosylase/DNA-(apurinic or apyrimidinic site) lyase [uncultured Propionibacterium sp.]